MRNLRTWTALSTLGLVLSIGACGDDDDNGATTATTTMPTTNDTMVTGTGTTNDTTDPETGTTDDPTADGTTTGDVPEVCIVEDDDSECAVCTKENCCDQLAACVGNETCACLVACVNESGLPTDEALALCSMRDQCNIGTEDGQNPFPAEAIPLQTCNGANCMEACS